MFWVVAAPAGEPPTKASRADAYYHYSLGLQARFEDEDQKALEELTRATRLDPGAGYIRAEIARLLRDTGRIAEALEEAKKAVELDPEDPELRIVLGQL